MQNHNLSTLYEIFFQIIGITELLSHSHADYPTKRRQRAKLNNREKKIWEYFPTTKPVFFIFKFKKNTLLIWFLVCLCVSGPDLQDV
jgi:hypothetical protein